MDDTKMLENGYCIVILDGRHQRPSVETLRHEDGMEWPAKPLRPFSAFRVNGKSISPTQKMKLNNTSDIFSEIMWLKQTVKNMMQTLLNYERDFEKGYGVQFVYVRITNIV